MVITTVLLPIWFQKGKWTINAVVLQIDMAVEGLKT